MKTITAFSQKLPPNQSKLEQNNTIENNEIPGEKLGASQFRESGAGNEGRMSVIVCHWSIF
jgi:hypothetical protein